MHEVIIIGGGPAGLTAAVYCLRKRLDCLLIAEQLGGKAAFRVDIRGEEPYKVIRGQELISGFKNELEYLKFAFRKDTVSDVVPGSDCFTVKTASGQEIEGTSVILATGVSLSRLDVPGEGKLMGKGLGYSSISYSHLLYGKKVFLTGDGMRVISAAEELSRQSEQLLLHMQEIPDGCWSDLKRVSGKDNVSLIEGGEIFEFRGSGYAESVVVRDAQGTQVEYKADAFFIENECRGNSRMVSTFAGHDTNGRIKVDTRNRSSAPGLFAAGDVSDAPMEQILVAVGEGAKAALSAYEFLLERDS